MCWNYSNHSRSHTRPRFSLFTPSLFVPVIGGIVHCTFLVCSFIGFDLLTFSCSLSSIGGTCPPCCSPSRLFLRSLFSRFSVLGTLASHYIQADFALCCLLPIRLAAPPRSIPHPTVYSIQNLYLRSLDYTFHSPSITHL